MKFFAIFIAVLGLFTGIGFATTASSYLYSQTPLEVTSLSGQFDSADAVGTFNGSLKQSELLTDNPQLQNVLGTTSSDKRIEVDLTNQRIYAFEGDRKVYDFLVSTGKWNRTPTGTFRIWTKLRYTKMSGGSKALRTYYYLPNVPFTMFFANNEYPAHLGYGIHGTYWHNNFGHPMSHGCVNMKTEEVEKLFYWANPDLQGKSVIRATNDNPGTPVIIYGKAPSV